MEKEENPFEEPIVAQEWIHAVEYDKDGSRDAEIYPLLLDWITKISPQVTVEVGAGQGICSSKINLTAGKYIGVEPSEPLVHRAKELYPETNKVFLIGSAYNLPVENEMADAVFSVGVWFHLQDLDAAAQEVARVLKSGGKVMIVTSNPEKDHVWESFFDGERVGNLLHGSVRLPAGTVSKNTFYLHSEDDVVSSLRKAGLSVLSIEKFGVGKRLEGDKIWMAVEGVKD